MLSALIFGRDLRPHHGAANGQVKAELMLRCGGRLCWRSRRLARAQVPAIYKIDRVDEAPERHARRGIKVHIGGGDFADEFGPLIGAEVPLANRVMFRLTSGSERSAHVTDHVNQRIAARAPR